MDLPTGTVSFLFTDLEGSTRLLESLGDRYGDVLERHRDILRSAIEAHAGVVFGTEGDAVFAAFASAGDAVAAAAEAQRGLTAHRWPEGARVRVRMAVHTGDARLAGGEYVGMALHVTARVCAAGHGGQVLLTGVTRALVPGCEVRDLGEHHLKDLPDTVPIAQLVGEGLFESFPALRTSTAAPNNLPAATDEFIGRAAELAGVIEGLDGHRLVTLTGAGGNGKSRLALEAAGRLLGSLRDGAWFVELAASSDASRVPALVASVLDLGERPGEPVEDTVAEWLRSRELLLIIDNCEHLVEGVAEFADRLLRACPHVRILATSRELLGVRGEVALRVPPLPIDGDAIELFVTRARAAMPTFAPEPADLELVGQVCRRLDGMPLAIELAAARLRTLSLPQLASRLDDRFRLLTGGSRADLSRQRTLEAVVAWSYDLLTEAERELFRTVSVFPDSFTLDAAAAITGDDTLALVDGLGRLVEKSLILRVESGAGADRYQLLETLRQYGRDRLLDHGEAEDRRDLLLTWALAHVDRLESDMRTPAQDAAIAAVMPERMNLRAAMEWGAERGEETAALRLVSAAPIGLNSERRALIAELLDRGGDRHPVKVVAQAHLTLANLAFEQSDWDADVQAAATARTAFEQVGDRLHANWATYFVVVGSWGAGDLTMVDRLWPRVLAEFRSLDDDFGIAYTLWIASQRATDTADAAAMAEEADRRFRELGSPMGLAHAVEGRALIALDSGDFDAAVPYLREAVALFVDGRNAGCTAHALEAVAVWAAATGDGRSAAELVGAADALRHVSGQGHRPWEIRARRGEYDSSVLEGVAGADEAIARGKRHSLVSVAELVETLLDASSSVHARIPG